MERKCFGLALALTLVVSVGAPAFAAEIRDGGAAEGVSGYFYETVSAGKIKKLGSAILLQIGEIVNFNATYSLRDASVDFGVVDSNNVFTYLNETTGSIDDGVTIPESGEYTPAIRNNSSESIYVSGSVERYLPESE